MHYGTKAARSITSPPIETDTPMPGISKRTDISLIFDGHEFVMRVAPLASCHRRWKRSVEQGCLIDLLQHHFETQNVGMFSCLRGFANEQGGKYGRLEPELDASLMPAHQRDKENFLDRNCQIRTGPSQGLAKQTIKTRENITILGNSRAWGTANQGGQPSSFRPRPFRHHRLPPPGVPKMVLGAGLCRHQGPSVRY